MADWTHELILSDNPALESLGYLLQGGSRFMIEAAESTRAWCIVDRSARNVRYYWHRNSTTLKELFDECRVHGFDSDAPSWSRLCKHVFKKEISEGLSGIRPHPYYKSLAEQKWHWHAMKSVPGYYQNVSEIDIKSAYAQAIRNSGSLYRASRFAEVDDSGCMDRWRSVYPTLSKKLRLAMVGWLSGYRIDTVVPPTQGEFLLQRKTLYKTFDGGIFNTIHHSLEALYVFMRDCAAVSPEHTPRVHTDSLWITGDIPDIKLNTLLDLIDSRGYSCSIKGHGDAVLFDLNSAILGGHIVGIPSHTEQLFERFCEANPHIVWNPKQLDSRLVHLLYKNERISLRQHRAISAIMREK